MKRERSEAMRRKIVLVFTVLALAAGLVCMDGPAGSGAFAKRVKEKDEFTVLHSFAGPDGAIPYGSLTLSGTTLYGMTEDGGAYKSKGVLFSYNIKTKTYTLVHSFGGTVDGVIDGSYPSFGNGVILSGQTLYGTTYEGGEYGFGDGVLFSYDIRTGVYTLLYSFGSTANDGTLPPCTPVLSGETLYGMTYEGGANGYGTIFAFDITTGEETILHSFDKDGEYPYGSLTLSGETLYGMTEDGGYDGDGSIFAINRQNGEFTVLHQFWGYDGSYPSGNLTLSGTTLYGMTFGGGEYDYGTIFTLNTENGELTTLYSFQGKPDGAVPYGSLTLSGTTLYGMTYEGGANGYGTIFAFDITTGEETILHSFMDATTDGANPYGSLILSGKTLYGMTYGGGEYGYGVIFSSSLE